MSRNLQKSHSKSDLQSQLKVQQVRQVQQVCAAGALPDALFDVEDRGLGDEPLHPHAPVQGVDGDLPGK